MQHTELGPLLTKRLAKNEHLVDEMLVFVDVRISTARDWIYDAETGREKPQYPRGEKLNRLWHFLATAGVSSPELAKLPEFGAYLGKLMAFGCISLEEARQFCGLKNVQGALRVIWGEQQPSNPKESIESLREVFDSELRDKEEVLRTKLGKLTKPEATEQKPEPVTEAAPPRKFVPIAEVRPVSRDEATPKDEPAPKASPADNTELIMKLALDIGALHVLAQHALATLSPEELAQVRTYVNGYVVFGLSNALNRMSSTRALNEGR